MVESAQGPPTPALSLACTDIPGRVGSVLITRYSENARPQSVRMRDDRFIGGRHGPQFVAMPVEPGQLAGALPGRQLMIPLDEIG